MKIECNGCGKVHEVLCGNKVKCRCGAETKHIGRIYYLSPPRGPDDDRWLNCAAPPPEGYRKNSMLARRIIDMFDKKSGDTKIDWATKTVNPLGWGCYGPKGTKENPQPCEYCYAHNNFAKRNLRKCPLCREFTPHTHFEQLEKIRKYPNREIVFVQSMGDLLHPEIPAEWKNRVFEECAKEDRHTYMFLTKCPDQIMKVKEEYLVRDNFWFGTTITTPEDPYPFHLTGRVNLFLSIEPLLAPFPENDNLAYYNIKWVIVGAENNTRGNKKVIPHESWASPVIKSCMTAGVPVFLKNSMRKHTPTGLWQQNWPDSILKRMEER